MGELSAILEDGGGLLADAFGEEVVYHAHGRGAKVVKAYAVEDEMQQRRADTGRAPARRLYVRVAMRDVPAVTIKRDTISRVPASWVGRTGDTVSVTVQAFADGTRTRPGMHTLVCVVAGGAS